MNEVHPFWSSERRRAFIEAALIVFAYGTDEDFDSKTLVSYLTPDSQQFVADQAYAEYVNYEAAFAADLVDHGIVRHDTDGTGFRLAKLGGSLVNVFFEQMMSAHSRQK